ncbi:MAG: ATPase V [Bacteroidales bacterium]|nr:ATPase V [Bacteroidales bacterium]
MITSMTKYSFVLVGTDTAAFLERIQELGVVDITRSARPTDEHSLGLLSTANGYKDCARKLAAFVKSTGPGHKGAQIELPSDASSFAILANRLLDTQAHAVALEKELRREAEQAALWGDYRREDLEQLRNMGVSLSFHCCSEKKFQDSWTKDYALCELNRAGGRVYFMIAAPKGEAVAFPLETAVLPARPLHEIEAEIEQAAALAERSTAELLTVAEHCDVLKAGEAETLGRLDLYLAGAASVKEAEDHINVLEGFAPSGSDKELKVFLDSTDCLYVSEKAQAQHNPPIKLRNSKFIRNFEFLTGMYGMPVYSEFDPTPILGPFFLLFFAMCMGDAGYGILLLLIGLYLGRGKGSMAKMGPLVTYLGISTLVIGLALGTFFGINLYEASWYPEALKKCIIHGKFLNYDLQMVLAICIGVFHICLAMTIKAISYTCAQGFRASVSAWGWLLLIVGGLVTGGLSLSGVIGSEITKWVIIVIGVVSGLGIYIFNTPGRNPLINIGAGLWGTYNMVTGLLGDVLSYIRLYALGLAGGMLGSAFNDLAQMIGDGIPVPGLNYVPMVIILLIGHALNLAMSCLGAFVHPLRLTFVEYFKNVGYEGKGRGYRPLTKTIDNQ